MSDELKNQDGPVSVDHNADVTPITKKPIDKINASTWEDMSYDALSTQYNMLQNRIDMAMTMGRGDLVKQMQNGKKYLLQLMEDKKPTDSVSFL